MLFQKLIHPVMNNDLEERIEKITAELPYAKLERAASELSLAYRVQTDGIKTNKPFMFKDEHKMAYLALRMPATYAAIANVLKAIPIQVHSLLDIGSGPGTAYFAAQNQFPELTESLLVEKDPYLARLGKALLERKPANYCIEDIKAFTPSKSYSLITAAYSLSELSEPNLEPILEKLWAAADPLFCVIEPGTPYGFKTILQTRNFLIKKNAFILAPCTHENACPWQDTKEWCHFSVRFDRTRLQRRVKGGVLGYEDEKYSYVIASKIPLNRPEARIVKSPIKRSGFINLTLCDATGIHDQILSKKNKDAYQDAKRLDWGDPL